MNLNKKTWICEICGHENLENEDLCEICGAYREESSYDAISDEDDLDD